MTKVRNSTAQWAFVVFIGAALGLSGTARAGETNEETTQQVRKIKTIRIITGDDCDGKECPEAGGHRIIVEQNGKLQEILGNDCEEDCLEQILFVSADDPDNIHEISGHHHDLKIERCEDEEKDCPRLHRIVVKRTGSAGSIHAAESHDLDWVAKQCEGEDCEKVHRIVIDTRGAGHHELENHSIAFVDGDGGHVALHRGLKRGFLGVRLTELTPDLREHFGVSADAGVMVGQVLPDSAAEDAGIQVGDIVTSVDGRMVGSAMELSAIIGGMDSGTSVTLGVWREGVAVEATAILRESGTAPGEAMRRIVVVCDDERCDEDLKSLPADFECPEGGTCEIEVRCEQEECSCSMNGVTVDCETLGVSESGND